MGCVIAELFMEGRALFDLSKVSHRGSVGMRCCNPSGHVLPAWVCVAAVVVPEGRIRPFK
jgi:hypothetical protein